MVIQKYRQQVFHKKLLWNKGCHKFMYKGRVLRYLVIFLKKTQFRDLTRYIKVNSKQVQKLYLKTLTIDKLGEKGDC